MIDTEARPRIPEYGSDEHKRQIARRLSRNLRFRFWLREVQPRALERKA